VPLIPPPKRHPYDQSSPDARALELVGDKWTLLIVRDLAAGPRRFVALQRALPGISTEQLRSRLSRMGAGKNAATSRHSADRRIVRGCRLWRRGVAGNDGPWLHGRRSISMSWLSTGRCLRTSGRWWVPSAVRRGRASRLLKFYTCHGRVPAGGAELPGAVVEFVAAQVGVSPAEMGSYEWADRSIERHRAQIREHLGFRECSVADAEQLAAWLAEHVVERERRPERVREELLARCLSERIEPPVAGGAIASCDRPFAPAKDALGAGRLAAQRRVEDANLGAPGPR
jgi:hypothetical protein